MGNFQMTLVLMAINMLALMTAQKEKIILVVTVIDMNTVSHQEQSYIENPYSVFLYVSAPCL